MVKILFGSEIEGTFTHWVDAKDVDAVINHTLKTPEHRNSFKPHGVWLSWNGDWERWFESEWKSWAEGKVCLRARIHPRATIVVIDTVEDLKELMVQAGIPLTEENIRFYRNCEEFWEALRGQFDGIALTEAGQWRTRMTTFLYGWDCASICIHNPAHVTFTRDENHE